MQHIQLQLEDENRKVIETSAINFAGVMTAVYKIKDFKIQYPWLSTIDPYGDTVFNKLQVPYIINELSVLANKSENNGLGIKESVSFIQKIDTHQFITFYGD